MLKFAARLAAVLMAAATVQISTPAYATIATKDITFKKAASVTAPASGYVKIYWSSVDDSLHYMLSDSTDAAVGGSASTGNWTFSSDAFTLSRDMAVGTAQTVDLKMANTTAATSGSGNQQYSPVLALCGKQWNGSASVAVCSGLQQVPVTGGTDSGSLVFWGQYNGGSWAKLLSVVDNAGSTQLISAIANTYLQLGSNIIISANGGFILPAVDNNTNLGNPGGDTWAAVAAHWFTTKVGTQLTAANTITPAHGIHHVTGATVIKTIATTYIPGAGAQFTMIADTNTVNWDATGNIAVAGSVTSAGRTITFTWDGTSWYPSATS